MAFRAYKKYISNHGKAKDQRLPGYMKRFTGEQLFFISFASVSDEMEGKIATNLICGYHCNENSLFNDNFDDVNS